MSTKFLSSFILILLLGACAPRATNTYDAPTAITTLLDKPKPTKEENVEPSEQDFRELCQSAGHQGLANFYPNVDYSPKREWAFISCENFSANNSTYPFIISRISNEQTQILSPKFISPDWIAKDQPTSFKPEYWNNDESVLIIRSFILPCPENFLCLYSDGEALYDVNLESGEFSTLLDPQATSSYAFSVSPDGKYLGYVNQATPEEVYIRDLSSGKENKILLQGKFLKVGAFVWTPDSKEILFFGISYTNELFYSSLFLFDRINSSLSILLDNHPGTYFPGDWSSNTSDYWYQPDVLSLGSVDSPHLYINIRTKEINQVSTATP